MRRLVALLRALPLVLLPAVLALALMGLSWAQEAQEAPAIGLQLWGEVISAEAAAELTAAVRARVQQKARAGVLAEISLDHQPLEAQPAAVSEPPEEEGRPAAEPAFKQAREEQHLQKRQRAARRARDRAHTRQGDPAQAKAPAAQAGPDLSRRLLDDASNLSGEEGKPASVGQRGAQAGSAGERLHAPPEPGAGPGPKASEPQKLRQGPLGPGHHGPSEPPGERFGPAGSGSGSAGPRR